LPLTSKVVVDKDGNTSQKPSLLSTLERAEALEASFKGKFQNAEVKAELEAIGRDLDAIHAEYARRRQPLPPMLVFRRSPERRRNQPKARGFTVLMDATQKAEYDGLPDGAKPMYRTARMNGASHGVAMEKAREFAPARATHLKLGRKVTTKNGAHYKVDTPEGDSYTIQQTPGGQWHATYVDAGSGETIDVTPAMFKDEHYALAALEAWHDEWHRRQNAGLTRPDAPAGSGWHIGNRRTKTRRRKTRDFYRITTARGDTYDLVYDRSGWYTVFYDKNNKPHEVDGKYYADGEGALKALQATDEGYYSRRPVWERHAMSAQQRRVYDELSPAAKQRYTRSRDMGKTHAEAMKDVRNTSYGTRTGAAARSGKPKTGNRVITQRTIDLYDKHTLRTLKTGHRIAVNEPSFGKYELPSSQSDLVLKPVIYQTVSRIDGNFIIFTNGARVKVPNPAQTIYRLPTDEEHRARRGQKDVYSGMVPGFGQRVVSGGVVRRRKPRASLRARRVAAKPCIKALEAFLALHGDIEEKVTIRHVRTAEGARKYGVPIGSVIKLDKHGNVIKDAVAKTESVSAKKPKAGDIFTHNGKPHHVDHVYPDSILYSEWRNGRQYGPGRRMSLEKYMAAQGGTGSAPKPKASEIPVEAAKLPKPKVEDGWTIYDIDLLGTKYGITNDSDDPKDPKWYSYDGNTEEDTDGESYATPEAAMAALIVYHATGGAPPKKATAKKPAAAKKPSTAKKKPVTKTKVGGKLFPPGTKLKAGDPPPAKRPLGERKPFRDATDAEVAKLVGWWGTSVQPTPAMLRPTMPDGSPRPKLQVNPLALTGEDDSAVLKGMSDDGKWKTLYTPNHIARQDAAKHKRSAAGMHARADLEMQVAKDVAKDDAAAMLSLMLFMGLRPDTSGGEQLGQHQGYGASTLERRHVITRGGKMFLKFAPGKKHGQEITLEVKNPVVMKALKARLNKKPNERLFGVSETRANAYLKEHMGNFKMKDLRTMMGTDLALKFIADPANGIQQPKSEAELKRIKKQVATHVSDNLGNTPAVALSAYIDPAIWETWEEAFEK
jgi:hypothetical protein